MKLFAGVSGGEVQFDLTREGTELAAGKHRIRFESSNGIIKSVVIDGIPLKCAVIQSDGVYHVTVRGTTFQVTVDDLRSEQIKEAKKASAAPGEQTIRAPIPGIIKKVFLKAGDAIQKGTPVCTLVAMKMENEITSHLDGVVAEIFVAENATVNKDNIIAKISAK